MPFPQELAVTLHFDGYFITALQVVPQVFERYPPPAEKPVAVEGVQAREIISRDA
jgi:hypothetical protein